MTMMEKKTGVVLAAGTGSRLSPDEAKPLVAVDRIGLMLRTLASLEMAGCRRAVMVLGWQAEIIQAHIESTYTGTLDLNFAINPDYHLQNGLSVLSARPLVRNDFILTMADHILDDAIMERVRFHQPPEGGATLCVDYKLDTIFDMDDATKVETEGTTIKNIGKELEAFNCVDTGVFVCTRGLMDGIEAVYRQKGDASLSEGVKRLADQGKMEALDIGDSYWQDVDTPDMLTHAEKLLEDRK
jgi:choline kinase